LAEQRRHDLLADAIQYRQGHGARPVPRPHHRASRASRGISRVWANAQALCEAAQL
jgi:hypothetical protein